MATTEDAGAKRRRRRPRPYPTILTSLALFAIVVAVLAGRVAAGTDPVLGAMRHVVRPRPEIVRRIVRRVIIETTVPAHSRLGARGTTVSSAPVTTAQSPELPPEPVTRSS
jgi:hypothetical protein